MKRTFTLLLAVGLAAFSFAQNLGSGNEIKLDAGLRLGLSYGMTDVDGIISKGSEGGLGAGWQGLTIGNGSPAFGAYARYQLSDLVSLNAGFNRFSMEGNDADSRFASHVARNLSYTNNMWDIYARGEIYFYSKYNLGKSPGSAFINNRNNLRFFVFGGVGTFYSNPKAELGGTTYELREFRTEGQTESEIYNKWNFSIPYGIGGYYTFNGKWRLGLEMGWRKTFTDYIDDVSGLYPTFEEMAANFDPVTDANNYAIAVALSNRNPELTGSNTDLPSAANYGLTAESANNQLRRGNEDDLDSYGFTTFTICYILGQNNNKFNKSKKTKAKF